LKKICMPQQNLCVPQVKWGTENEKNGFALHSRVSTVDCDVASSSAMHETCRTYVDNDGPHINFSSRKCGLVIEVNSPYLAASPDGFMSCDCHGPGVIEIKCPYSCRDGDLSKLHNNKDFCFTAEMKLKTDHKWYSQVQFEMYVCDVLYCDFVLWTPGDCVVKRVMRDNLFIGEMIQKCMMMWQRHILPEILTRRQENTQQSATNAELVAQATSDTQPLYCICRSSSIEGSMVGCDKCNEWFHVACLGLKRLPKSKNWYRKKCRKSM